MRCMRFVMVQRQEIRYHSSTSLIPVLILFYFGWHRMEIRSSGNVSFSSASSVFNLCGFALRMCAALPEEYLVSLSGS